MDREQFQQAKRIFIRASEIPEEKREAYLGRECAGDDELRAEVERLLAQPTDAIGDVRREVSVALEPTRLAGTFTVSASTPGPDDRIGPYRLLEKIGEGGMGEVWVAEQTDPVHRRVALKVIKRGMDSDQVVARFEAERQALAMMDHPAIAKVFDGGQTPQGRPYFVMEHIEGVPITEHCDRLKLTTRERLELFVRVCEGIQHAHQKAVIHRDIKPSNVLVTIRDGQAVPKIIDFGVAKATAQRLTEKTVYTELGVLIGTPEYMSPEQAEMTGQNIDTRTDVYSLGVLLYELLTGVLPFDSRDLREAGFDEIRRRIREIDPPRPSSRLSSLPGDRSTISAKNRKSEPSVLTRQIRGDLDWIAMKALEKDRTRRYGSASDLAMDVGRYLRVEPVSAGPPSGIYRARKFVRRHKAGVSVAALLAVLLIAFSVVTTIQSRRIAREAATTEQVSEFLVELFEVSDPSESRGNTITAREILDRGAQRIGEELIDQPEVRARMLFVLGDTYRRVGLFERGARLLREALRLSEAMYDEDDVRTLRALRAVAGSASTDGQFEEADRLFTELVERCRRSLGPGHPRTLDAIQMQGGFLRYAGRYEDAEAKLIVGLEDSRRALGPSHATTLAMAESLGNTYFELGRYEDAAGLYRDTHARREEKWGHDHPQTLWARSNLAAALGKLGRLEEAIEHDRAVLQDRRRVLGPDHPHTLFSMSNLGADYARTKQFDQAESLLREALEGRRRELPERHPDIGQNAGQLGWVLTKMDRHDEAYALLIEAWETYRDSFGTDHPRTLDQQDRLAWSLWKSGRAEVAELHYREVIAARDRIHGPDEAETTRIRRNFVEVLSEVHRGHLEAGRADEARRVDQEIHETKEILAGSEAAVGP